MNFSFLFLSVFIVLLGSCQKRQGVPLKNHESELTLTRNDLDEEKRVETLNSAKKQVEVYSPETAENTEIGFSPEVEIGLHEANKKTLSSKDQGEIDRFYILAMKGCDAQLNSCQSYQYLKQSMLSGRVLQAKCSQLSNIPEKYRCLMMAWDLSNGQWDQELASQYALHSRAYFDQLPQSSKELFERHRRILGLIIDAQFRSPEEKLIQSLVAQYKPQDADQTVRHPLGEHVIKLLRLSKNNVKLSPNPNFEILQNEFFKNHTAAVHHLKIQKANVNDQAVVLLGKMFDGSISPSDANEIVLSQGWKKSEEVKNTLLNYVRLRFAIQVLKTHQKVGSYFEGMENVPNRERLNLAFESADREVAHWQSLQMAIKRVLVFGEQFFGGQNPNLKFYQEVKDVSAGLPRIIKFMVTYPQMMMMTYFLSKHEFALTYRSMFREVTFNTAKIFTDLFAGTYYPWFQYSDEIEPLTPFEIIISLEWALKLGVFETFKVSAPDFIKRVQNELLSVRTQDLKIIESDLYSRYEGSEYWRQQQDLCAAIEKNLPLANPVSASELKDSILMGNRRNVMTSSERNLQNRWGTFMFDNTNNNELEKLRLNTLPLLRQLQFSIDLLKKDDQQRYSADEIAALQGRVDQFKTTTVKVLKKYIGYGRQIKNCFFRIYEKEKQTQMAVMKAEAQFLAQLHKDMIRAQSQPEQIRKLNEQYQFFALHPGAESQIIRFDGKNFTFFQLDFLKRLQLYSSSGYIAGELKIPAFNRLSQIRFPENFTETDLFKKPVRVSIPFIADEQEFIKQGLRVLFGSGSMYADKIVGWFDSMFYNFAGNFELWYDHLSSLARIMASNPEWQKETQFSVDELVELPLKVITLVNFSEEQEAFMKLIGGVNIFDTWSAAFFIDHNKPVPYFFFMHKWLYEPVIGWFKSVPSKYQDDMKARWPAEFQPLLSELEFLADFVNSQQKFLFETKLNSVELADQVYPALLKGQVDLVNSFEAKVKAKAEVDRVSGKQLLFHTIIGEKLSVPYLPDHSYSHFREHLSQFHRSTNYYYQSRK